MNILEQNAKKRLDFNPDLKQINFLDRRVYKRGEGVYYPSVTTILQYMPKNKFFESWLKDVGHNADLIMRRAGKEGTQVHEAAEALVKGEEVSWMDDYGNAKYSQIVWEMILKFHDFWVSKRRLYKLQNSKAVRLPCKIRRINAAFIHPAEGFNLSAVIKILAKCFENNFNKTMDYRFNTHFFTSWVLYFFRL